MYTKMLVRGSVPVHHANTLKDGKDSRYIVPWCVMLKKNKELPDTLNYLYFFFLSDFLHFHVTPELP